MNLQRSPLCLHNNLVCRFGGHSTAFQTLSSGFSFWRCDDDAGVAYIDTGHAWVAAGPPLAAALRHRAVAEAFVQAARSQRRRAVFFAAPEDLLDAGRSLVVGQEPFWDPLVWPASVKTNATLRQQLRRARNKGIRVRVIDPADLAVSTSTLRTQLQSLMTRWSNHHPMPPMGFLVDLNPFVRAQDRRYWLAEMHDPFTMTLQPIGFAAVAPIYGDGASDGDSHGDGNGNGKKSWLIEHILRDPTAANGCAELLVNTMMEALVDSPRVSLGIIPLYQVCSPLLRAVRWFTGGLYSFDGIARFKTKMRPQAWEAVCIVFPRRYSSVVALYDVLCAFAPQGLLRFAWGILGRGSPTLIYALSWVLVPWTVALASMQSDVWFPSKALQHFWTAFDIILAAVLFSLGRRWRQRLATILAAVVTADAVATAIEAVVYRQPTGLGADCIRALAVAAPTAAAVLLWQARAYHARHHRAG